MSTLTDDRIARDKERFLVALDAEGTVKSACIAAGVPRANVYRWLHEDSSFRAQVDDVREGKIEELEQSLYRRAVAGDIVASIFLLKAARPKVYCDRARAESIAAEASASSDEGTLRVAGMPRDEARRLVAQQALAGVARIGKLQTDVDGGTTLVDARTGDVLARV